MSLPHQKHTHSIHHTLTLNAPGLRWRQAFTLFVLASACGNAFARTSTAPDDTLAPTVITAVQQSSPLTLVTNPRDARQPVPASDATDYLKTIPGFSAIRAGGTNGDPVLRGMFGSRLNVLVNGGQMIGACPARMDAPSSYISPETFDRLTVVKGPQTVIWGPGASAGTVRFDREPEQFDEPGTRLEGSVLAGSHGRVDKVIDGAVGNSTGYIRMTGNQSRADDYDNGDGDTVPSKWEKWNGDVAVGWTPDADTLVELTAGKGDGESRYGGRSMDGSQFKRESLGLRFEKRNIGSVLDSLEGQVYYNYADHVMDNFRLRTPDPTSMMPMPMPMAAQVDRRTLGGRLAATFKWSEVDLVAGVDAQRSEHRDRSSAYDMMSQTYTDADAFAWNKDAVMHNYGAFSELTWYAAERNRVVAGARIDHAQAKDFRSTSGMMGMANPTSGKTRQDNLPSGFARVEHDLESLPATAYAGIGHVQRFPDYWELYSPGSGPTGSVNAFDAVKPEKTTQLDVGIQYKGDRFDAWASGYVGQVRDYILFSYSPGMMGDSSQAENIDARIMGGELGAAYRLTDHWKTDSTLAYAWGKNSSDGEALPQMPPLEARLGLTYQRSDWSAGALWRVVSQQNRVAEGKGNVVGQDFGKSSGFGVFSLNGAYRINAHFKVSAGVDNLFDRNYTEHLNLAGDAGFGYPGDRAIDEPGRTLWTKLDVKF
ncbi:TonB-dependent copper receptor [Pseudomonas matsuisoli]|uniref:Copper transporter porin n=1 Tax=Pseudomonas matsuisoli TaxID=1515666 RepID=A0A917UV26_9PSED|nr:TonB-dependent copper receptor [Pseudomonas matsuisoli]GGJ87455.1 copper transporter porin [Pseudomonas matsuisoli]